MKNKNSIINQVDFDVDLTRIGYAKLDLKFDVQEIKEKCLFGIASFFNRRNIDFGIDLDKPWEEIVMDNYYQIDYIFVGKFIGVNSFFFNHDEIGVSIYQEKNFGIEEFQNRNLLKIIFVIDK